MTVCERLIRDPRAVFRLNHRFYDLCSYAKQDVYKQVLLYKQSGLTAVCFLKTMGRIVNDVSGH